MKTIKQTDRVLLELACLAVALVGNYPHGGFCRRRLQYAHTAWVKAGQFEVEVFQKQPRSLANSSKKQDTPYCQERRGPHQDHHQWKGAITTSGTSTSIKRTLRSLLGPAQEKHIKGENVYSCGQDANHRISTALAFRAHRRVRQYIVDQRMRYEMHSPLFGNHFQMYL